MHDTKVPPHVAARLRAVLEVSSSGIDELALADARAVDPDVAGEVLADAIADELERTGRADEAIRAVHVAAELRLVGVVPALVGCIERLPCVHPLRHAALTALARFGGSTVDALLAAFERCETVEGRSRIAEALARAPLDDARVRGAFVRMLEDDAAEGARHLAERGEWRAAEALSRAIDRLARVPVADCDICHAMELDELADALRILGGALTDEQAGHVQRAIERGDRHMIPWQESSSPRKPAVRPARPGRNAPCPCGSGKKYKNCHLAADASRGAH